MDGAKKIIPNEVTQISKDKHYTFSLISGAAMCAAVHRVRCLWNEERLPPGRGLECSVRGRWETRRVGLERGKAEERREGSMERDH